MGSSKNWSTQIGDKSCLKIRLQNKMNGPRDDVKAVATTSFAVNSYLCW